MNVFFSPPTAEATAPSERRSSRTGTTSTSQTNTESCSVWETTANGCRVEIEASRLWRSFSPGSAPWISPCLLDWMSLMSRGRARGKRKRNLWTHLESSPRSFTVPASTRDEAAALRQLWTDVTAAQGCSALSETEKHSTLHAVEPGTDCMSSQPAPRKHCPVWLCKNRTEQKCREWWMIPVLSVIFHPATFSNISPT